jgi:S1-C subfamily serine protease
MERSTARGDSLSQVLAEAVVAASTSVVRVEGRPGPAASGVAFAPDLILTAEHAMDPAVDDVRVGLAGGEVVEASLAGRDPTTDLAVLRVPDGRLTPATAARAESLAGSLALIVARPSQGVLTSFGVLSGAAGPVRTARRGVIERLIYVDAVMYPGFSGGALIDTDGGVLGIASSGHGLEGPSSAIPWADATRLGRILAEKGRIQRGHLGVKTQPVELGPAARAEAGGQNRGLLVLEVEVGGPAEQGGLLQGDIAVRLNGEPIQAIEEMQGDVFTRRIDYPPFPFPPPVGMPMKEDLLFNLPVPPSEAEGARGKRVLFLRHITPQFGPGLGPHMAPLPPHEFGLFWRGEARNYADDLQALLGPQSVGTSITIAVLRGESLRDLQITVGARSGD